MKNFSFLWACIKGSRLLYFLALMCVLASALLTLLTPYVVKVIIDWILGDALQGPPDWVARLIRLAGGRAHLRANLWICGLAIVAATVLNGAILFGRGVLCARTSERITRKLRDRLYAHIQKLPYADLVRIKTGDFIQRCTSDVDVIKRFLESQLVEAGRTFMLIVSILFVMLTQSVRFTLVSMPILPLIFLFSLIFFYRVRGAFQQTDEAEGRMVTALQENLTGVKVVRAFARQRYELDKFEGYSVRFRDLDLGLGKLVAYFWAISDFLCMFQTGTIIVVGVLWSVSGAVTLGTVLLFLNYEAQLLWPIRQLAQILSDLGKMSISIARLREILDMPAEDMREDGLKPEIRGEVVFDRVGFRYPGEAGSDGTLTDISFSVKKGQTVAIMGPTGSGKTSLVQLLAALYDYDAGSIRLDGVELKTIDKKWLRAHVGIVEQEVFLFSRTVEENMAVARPDSGPEELYASARLAEIHHVIEGFRDGYQTLVGERGVTLSGGQKQRIAIARTVLGQYPILVFDDSLSAVDTETDAAIRRALKARSKDVTTFIIAHRVTTLFDADLILVLEGGRIAQAGAHGALIRQPGLYRRIWEIQSQTEEGADGDAF
jgi:ATP-binding cassette subfamily B protein